jgi:hypothetical protein
MKPIKTKRQRPKKTKFKTGQTVQYFNGLIYKILNTGTLYSICVPHGLWSYAHSVTIKNQHLQAYEPEIL